MSVQHDVRLQVEGLRLLASRPSAASVTTSNVRFGRDQGAEDDRLILDHQQRGS